MKTRREFLKRTALVGPAIPFAAWHARGLASPVLPAPPPFAGFDPGVPGLPRMEKPGLYLLEGGPGSGKSHILQMIMKSATPQGRGLMVSYAESGFLPRNEGLINSLGASNKRLLWGVDGLRGLCVPERVHQAAVDNDQYVVMTTNGCYSYSFVVRDSGPFRQIWRFKRPGEFEVVEPGDYFRGLTYSVFNSSTINS